MSSVTIRDVARYAGVGVGTVSRVLNDNESVSKPTRAKVLAAIAALEYRPNSTARRLSLGKTQTIAVILPYFTMPSYVERLRGVNDVLSESTYDFILFSINTEAKRHAIFHDLARGDRADGALVITVTPDEREAAKLLQRNMPVVLIDAHHSDLVHIMIDDVDGGYRATRHLIELGHERIAYQSVYLEHPMSFGAAQNRFLGYYQALEEAGLTYRPQYFRQGEQGRPAGRTLAHQLLALPEPPTAIFAHSDGHAIGAIEAARELGLRVPEDLSIVGFDDIEISELLGLTTVHQQLYESGRRGAELLLQLLAGKPAGIQEIILPTDLIIRQTTASPPNGVPTTT